MRRIIVSTGDGSDTLYVPELNEHYHSIHGAIQESKHIFINTGLKHIAQDEIAILEAGFGTGLNAWLTLLESKSSGLKIYYHSIEKYPLSKEEFRTLNYVQDASSGDREEFYNLHLAPWEQKVEIASGFTLYKQRSDLGDVDLFEQFDVVFYDAFAPEVQPNLWSENVLVHYYNALKSDGILVTYCVKGAVKRALRNIGFTLERLPGPPGKREILRATKH